MTIVKAHIEKRTFTEEDYYPDHGNRTESEEFREDKKKLKQDGHYKCFICGCTEKLEDHHYGSEWAFANGIDFDELKEFLLTFDVYGYSHAMKDIPLTSVDDIRNQMMLCTKHHRHPKYGIHYTTLSTWIAQKLEKAGVELVPEEG
jgi:hypothetical protein